MEKLFDVNKLYQLDSKLRKEDVEVLLKWCQQQRHFPKVQELQAALALHACFYSIEQAKNCLDNYFTIRGMCTEFFSNTNPDSNFALNQSLHSSLLTILPEKTPEGYYVFLARLMDTNPDKYNPTVDCQIFDMHALRQIHVDGPANGIVAVLDMQGAVFGHLTKLNLGEFKKFMVYLQTAMPIRLMTVHFINVVSFMDKLMAVIKPFINKELYDKIIIHTNNDNLYKYVPKEAMPVEYGGKGEPLQHLLEKSIKQIHEYQWFYDFQKEMVADENKRIGPRKNAENLFGFDGTFKKLNVD